jgi:hypothetical protein
MLYYGKVNYIYYLEHALSPSTWVSAIPAETSLSRVFGDKSTAGPFLDTLSVGRGDRRDQVGFSLSERLLPPS